MRIFAKNLPCKNFATRLSGIRRNGRYSCVIENAGKNATQLRPAIVSNVDKTSPNLCSAALKVNVSNFRTTNSFWRIPKANAPIQGKFLFHFLNKSSTSALVWSKKSYSDCKKVDANYDYPHLSKIFGTENLLKSDAYNQAVIEAAKRRAALQEYKTASVELKNEDVLRPQVNIKGWGASKTNIKQGLETKSQPLLKTNMKRAAKNNSKDMHRQPSDLCNADTTNLTRLLKTKHEASKACPPPVKVQQQIKSDSQKDGLLKSSNIFTAKDLERSQPCESSDLRRTSNTGISQELKSNSHPTNDCPPPAKLKKHADGDCKKDDPCKPADPCKPFDPCKEELEQMKRKKEEELKKNKNKMPTGCVDPKCKKDDKYKKSKSPSKLANFRNRPRRRISQSFKAVKRLKGCGNAKVNCNDNTPCHIQKMIDFDRKKRSCSVGITNQCRQKDDCTNKDLKKVDSLQNQISCGNSKQNESPCKKVGDICGFNKQKDDTSGSKKKDPCLDKKSNPDNSKKDPTSPYGEHKELTKDPCKINWKPEDYGKQRDPCGSRKQIEDPCQDKNSKSTDNCKKDSISPCGKRKEESTKDPCKNSPKQEDPSKQKDRCGSRQQMKDPSQNKDPCQDKKSKSADNCKKDSISPCGKRKEESTTDPCKNSPKQEDPSKQNDPCGSSKQMEGPSQKKDPCQDKKSKSTDNCKKDPTSKEQPTKDTCKIIRKQEEPNKKDPYGSNKPAAESTDSKKKDSCQDKKSSPCSSRTEQPNKEPCKTCTSVEKKEATSPSSLKTAANRSCGSLKDKPRKDSSKVSLGAAKNESSIPSTPKTAAQQDCGKTKRDTTPNDGNLREALSSSDSIKVEPGIDPCQVILNAEKKVPLHPAASNTFSSCGSLKAEQRKDLCRAAIKETAGPCVPKSVESGDCGKPNRSTKPNCSHLKDHFSSSGSIKKVPGKDNYKASASVDNKETASQNKSKTAAADSGKQKKRPKPDCGNIRKSFSTLASTANQIISTLPSIKHHILMRKFSSKSRDKNKKDPDEMGKSSQCKSVGTTVPTHRKPVYNPHPNENLRQCYPTYDMDCKKLCKDARKTDCRKYAFLEQTNTNKRKGKK